MFVCREFMKSAMNWIDVLAVLPFFLFSLSPHGAEDLKSLGFLRMFRFIRVVRLVRLSRYSKRIKVKCFLNFLCEEVNEQSSFVLGNISTHYCVVPSSGLLVLKRKLLIHYSSTLTIISELIFFFEKMKAVYFCY